MFAPRLVIMVKDPIAGRVKTRLAREIGVVAATSVYRTMLGTLTLRLAPDRRWQTTFAVSPDNAVMSRALPNAGTRAAQGLGDLGTRLRRIADGAPRGPLVIIGSDCPSVSANDIAVAFRLLRGRDAVIAPAGDGGYWLIGLKHRPRRIRPFESIRWSTPDALADTRRQLAGADVADGATRDDIDDASGLCIARPILGRVVLPRTRQA